MKERRHRKGYRPGNMSDRLRYAIRDEAGRIEALPSPADRVRAIGDMLAALDVELETVVEIRLRAILGMRSEGLTYDAIAAETGLSQPRVAQLARQASRQAK